MLEIKCPASRKIEIKGNLIKTKKQKGIVPNYYWTQVQLQMEVCDLDECDFLQCSIDVYESRDQYLKDIVSTNTEFYEEQGVKVDVKNTIKKGAILELMPSSHIMNPHIYNAKYIYPRTIDMSTEQYEDWIMDTIYNLHKTNPDLKDYYFHRVVYWKITCAHKILVKRDREWFDKNLQLMKKFWDNVLYYRQHPDELDSKLEEMRKSEPKLGGGYLPTPKMYKHLEKKMDLSCNPYAIKKEEKNDKKPDTKNSSVFMASKSTSKKTYKYEPKDDFLSSSTD
jgi:hypothetical protein